MAAYRTNRLLKISQTTKTEVDCYVLREVCNVYSSQDLVIVQDIVICAVNNILVCSFVHYQRLNKTIACICVSFFLVELAISTLCSTPCCWFYLSVTVSLFLCLWLSLHLYFSFFLSPCLSPLCLFLSPCLSFPLSVSPSSLTLSLFLVLK